MWVKCEKGGVYWTGRIEVASWMAGGRGAAENNPLDVTDVDGVFRCVSFLRVLGRGL